MQICNGLFQLTIAFEILVLYELKAGLDRDNVFEEFHKCLEVQFGKQIILSGHTLSLN